ncbi:unnamed protein product [Clonostachys chloroleuca]|uniref:CHAT domain-containing protein n=1 Tax=Clonostachys chloroleuca TaxID=1926264 RepID=A0AA35LNY3_9HYPO|nr:unnamed protein product [Clonostachys chloroleuca]
MILSTLIESRVKTNVAQRPEKAVVVGMQELRHAPQEVSKLEDLCRSMQLEVRKPRPYQKDVLAALNDCEIFHFAGHGKADSEDPSKSFLVLRDRPLAVANLFEINPHNRNPFLAYLSACGTGQVTHDELIDEGLHLIAACQLAGFRHVIGTLWKVNDQFCVDVATMTYEWMRKRGVSDESVSEGLHYANRSLRTQWVSENTARGASKLGTGVHEEDLQMSIEQSRSSQGKARDPGNVVSCDDIKLWYLFNDGVDEAFSRRVATISEYCLGTARTLPLCLRRPLSASTLARVAGMR